ncbi:predicted protein [Histoplasma mississippiense (nom. inval.)]|uniref:predicted protein n=1 Tax=Ajellomyces capsulatus (strain NAm1 / WU24) TaxID=2059318 RepID=UPI000157D201|nr:predicted protein [Histoplasma mississippiense (nom. inval.)]EDN04841.1 predicted protein [Histoplasma mississippiense (nom. inval.)]
MSKLMANGKAPATPPPAQTPPCSPIDESAQRSPTLDGMYQHLVVRKELKDLLVEVIQEVRANPTAAEPNTEGASSGANKPLDSKPAVAALGSKLDFKRVNEIWDKTTLQYKTKEAVEEVLDELDQYAFVVRTRTGKNSTKRTVCIDIKSKFLRGALQDVLKVVKSISLQEDKPSVELDLLYYFLPELETYRANAAGEPGRQDQVNYLSLLIEFVSTTYQPTTERLASQLASGQATWDILWAIFKPGSIIYTKCFGTEKPRCVVLNAIEEKTRFNGVEYYSLDCSYIDYDGKVLGKAGMELEIEKFRGLRPIHQLPAFPLQYHPEEATVRQNLIKCGRKFCGLAGTHIRHCRGTAFFMMKKQPVRVNIDSCVGIDASFFHEMMPNYSRPRIEKSQATGIDLDGAFWIDFADQVQKEKEQVKYDDVGDGDMDDDDYLICCPTVPGFSFTNNAFYEFAVDDIDEIKWSSTLFGNLTIPDEQRSTLMALAKTRMGVTPTLPFDDFVAGKGRGLITLTAEAMAENFERPLYPIPAAQLATQPDRLEDNLTRIFQIAKRFDALLLLDEADVFLERRTSINMSKDAIVTIFLRKLEYSQGTSFLTTNRETEFDEAILSRIHLKIKYPNLSRQQRKAIWKHFVSQARTHQGPAAINDQDLNRLATSDLNGRDIKNLMSIAHALATVDCTRVSYVHIERASKSNEDYSREFDRVKINGMYT